MSLGIVSALGRSLPSQRSSGQGGYSLPQVIQTCLLYTSDAADERSSVDLGGRRIIKKKTHTTHAGPTYGKITSNRSQHASTI